MTSRASLSPPVSAESKEDMKYLLVSGGVISGVGKGVITSSIGTLLKSVGLRVTAIKIDPYLNIDAGTFSPYEHGVLVLHLVRLTEFLSNPNLQPTVAEKGHPPPPQ